MNRFQFFLSLLSFFFLLGAAHKAHRRKAVRKTMRKEENRRANEESECECEKAREKQQN